MDFHRPELFYNLRCDRWDHWRPAGILCHHLYNAHLGTLRTWEQLRDTEISTILLFNVKIHDAFAFIAIQEENCCYCFFSAYASVAMPSTLLPGRGEINCTWRDVSSGPGSELACLECQHNFHPKMNMIIHKPTLLFLCTLQKNKSSGLIQSCNSSAADFISASHPENIEW